MSGTAPFTLTVPGDGQPGARHISCTMDTAVCTFANETALDVLFPPVLDGVTPKHVHAGASAQLALAMRARDDYSAGVVVGGREVPLVREGNMWTAAVDVPEGADIFVR